MPTPTLGRCSSISNNLRAAKEELQDDLWEMSGPGTLSVDEIKALETEALEFLYLIRANKGRLLDLKNQFTAEASVPTPGGGENRRTMKTLVYEEQNVDVVTTFPSALSTARFIEDLDRVSYPEGICNPKPELNANSKEGKFRYDREFLLQFMAVCTEKPDVPLGVIDLKAEGDQQHDPLTRTASGRHRTSSASIPTPALRQASVTGSKSGTPGGVSMGNSPTPTRSQGGHGSNRTRSKRGSQRNEPIA